MRFERDEEAGITLRVNAIVQAVFILVALGLCVKFMLEASPRVLLAAVLVVCVIFMLIRMLCFIHLYGLWKNAYFEMGDDRVRGYGADRKLRHGRAFDVPAGDVKKSEIITVAMTQKTALDALKLTTADQTYIVVGLAVDEATRKALELDRD